MRVLRWLGKHKIWAYFIVTFFIAWILSAIFGFNPLGLGRIIGLLFIPYLFCLWAYSKAKREEKEKQQKQATDASATKQDGKE